MLEKIHDYTTWRLGQKVNVRNIFEYILKKKEFDKESQPAITCLKLTIETLEQGVKYVQN